MKLKYPFLDLGIINERYSAALKEAASRVIDSGRYVGGAENELFEKELAKHTGTKYAIGVSNGLDALRLIFKAYIKLGRLVPGDAVLVPSNTYIASVLAITDCQLVPIFVEPDPQTLNMDTSKIEEAICFGVRAILTVHLYGRPCYDEVLAKVAKEYDLLVVEDNAQAIGADAKFTTENGHKRTGALGDAAAFSFYPTKNLGALGDAGAVTTDDAELAAAVRALANYGSDRRYHNIYEGYNCRMDPIQAAFLRMKLPGLETENNHRRHLAAIYDKLIDNPKVIKPLVEENDGCVWHQYVLLSDTRDDFAEYLKNNGVGTDINYPVPPHLQPCYNRFAGTPLPIAENLAARVISLPISSCTSAEDATSIAAIINSYKG